MLTLEIRFSPFLKICCFFCFVLVCCLLNAISVPRIRLKHELKGILRPFLNLGLSLSVYSDVLISLIYPAAFEYPSLKCLAPKKRKKRKIRWQYCCWNGSPLSALEVTSVMGDRIAIMGGDAQTMATCLFLCISVIRSSNQQVEHRLMIFGRHDPFCSSWLLQLTYRLSRNMYTAVCHGTTQWGMGSCCYYKSWNWPKLTSIYHPCLFLEVTSL